MNDNIRIYFPSKKEEDGIAISSVKRQDPEIVPAAPKQVSTASPAVGKGGASGQSGEVQVGAIEIVQAQVQAEEHLVRPAE